MSSVASMRKVITSLVYFLFLLTFGCATADRIVYDNTVRTPTTEVYVYKDGESSNRKFKQIAELSFLGPREEELKAQKRFIRQAQKLGGNAILFSVVDGGSKGAAGAFSNSWVFKGKVIVYE